ncbi:MAG TPA: CHAD domain-containing protein [Rhodopila sp.]|nr:CHAD domain-containing protein [Rhodopila sp.]
MELELVADADKVAGLGRWKPLAASRNGRPRTQPVKIIWHDSPDHALLEDGLTLAEQRGVRRLERVVPGMDTWLPGQPVPVLGDADPLPSPLAPLAAFEGRQTVSVHQLGDQPVTLTVAKGSLRAVTAEQPAARIWLSGEEQAVRAMAMLLAEAVPITVPVASLAAEGIALATGRAAAWRRQGAPLLPQGTPDGGVLGATDAAAHVLGHLTDVILACAAEVVRQHGDAPEAVHQLRVAVRRARSALSIFRPALPAGALDTVGARLRELGRRLGPTRDWDVFVGETAPVIQHALPDDPRLQRLLGAASRRRQAYRKELTAFLDSAAFRALGIELAWFAAAGFWRMPPSGDGGAEAEPPVLGDFAAAVLQRRWKKLVVLGRRIEELDVASLHRVRLRAKRARYAAEVFSTLYQGRVAGRFIRRLSVLQQRLGVLNDGAVATHLLAELGGPSGRHGYATGVVAGFLAARAEKIRPRIIRAFEKFRRQPVHWA